MSPSKYKCAVCGIPVEGNYSNMAASLHDRATINGLEQCPGTHKQVVPITNEMPELYWSPTHGIVTVTEHYGETVWWRINDSKVSLRHDDFPNEKPEDAVRLIPAATGYPDRNLCWESTCGKGYEHKHGKEVFNKGM